MIYPNFYKALGATSIARCHLNRLAIDNTQSDFNSIFCYRRSDIAKPRFTEVNYQNGQQAST